MVLDGLEQVSKGICVVETKSGQPIVGKQNPQGCLVVNVDKRDGDLRRSLLLRDAPAMVSGQDLAGALLDYDEAVKAIRFDALKESTEVCLIYVSFMQANGIYRYYPRILLQKAEAGLSRFGYLFAIHSYIFSLDSFTCRD